MIVLSLLGGSFLCITQHKPHAPQYWYNPCKQLRWLLEQFTEPSSQGVEKEYKIDKILLFGPP